MPAPVKLIGSLDFSQPIRWGCPAIDEPADGWDTLREQLLLPDPGWLAKGTERPAPAGLSGRFFVQDVRITDWIAGKPLAEVLSYGLANNKPAKWAAQGLVNEDPRLVFGLFATVWRGQYPRITKRYISSTLPNLVEFVGVPSVPEVLFGVDSTPWNLTQIGPEWSAYGWIGESRTPEKLVGSDYCLVTDTWLYDLGYDRTDQTDAYYTGD